MRSFSGCMYFLSFYLHGSFLTNPPTHPYLLFIQIEKTVQINGRPLRGHRKPMPYSVVRLHRGELENILSRASGVGSPTLNHPGSRQRQDTGPGILWSVKYLDRANPVITTQQKLKKEERTVH